MKNEMPLLKTAIMADIHIWAKYPFRVWKLNRGLDDAKNCGVDAFLSLGDTSDHGEPEHWELIDKCFEKHAPCRDLIIAIGNHDTWTTVPEGTDDEQRAKISTELYIKHREIISGRKYDGKVYFSHTVNGYTFICIGSEGNGLGARISDEQLKWLEEEMKKATKDGKPVFVSCHQAFNGSHGLPVTFDKKPQKRYKPMEGGIGVRSDEVLNILKQYKNVFYFSGHSHMGLVNSAMYSTYEKVEGVHSFNLPCYMFANHHGHTATGYGYIMQVFEDRVEMRARNFNLRHDNHEFDYTVMLEK